MLCRHRWRKLCGLAEFKPDLVLSRPEFLSEPAWGYSDQLYTRTFDLNLSAVESTRLSRKFQIIGQPPRHYARYFLSLEFTPMPLVETTDDWQ
jgi:hypothetical protein